MGNLESSSHVGRCSPCSHMSEQDAESWADNIVTVLVERWQGFKTAFPSQNNRVPYLYKIIILLFYLYSDLPSCTSKTEGSLIHKGAIAWKNVMVLGSMYWFELFLSLHTGRGSSRSGRSTTVGHSPAAKWSASRAVEMCGLSPCYQVMTQTNQRIIGQLTLNCRRILFSPIQDSELMICNDYLIDWEPRPTEYKDH